MAGVDSPRSPEDGSAGPEGSRTARSKPSGPASSGGGVPTTGTAESPVTATGLWPREEQTWSIDLDFLGSYEFELTCIGASVGDLDKIDQWIALYMAYHVIPNLSVCVVSGDGRLVYAKGFTYPRAFEIIEGTSPGESIPTELFEATPDTRYRMNSVTKAITSVAIHQLMEQGLFSANTSFVSQVLGGPEMPASLPLMVVPEGASSARDLRDVTIHHLLRHRGGWCDQDPCVNWSGKLAKEAGEDIPSSLGDFGIDPLKADLFVAEALTGGTLPVTLPEIISFAFSADGYAAWNRDIAWAPAGRAHNYSNLGYSLLGRVVDQQAGAFRSYVEQLIFAPLGMSNSGWAENDYARRDPNEVAYYPDDATKTSLNLATGAGSVFLPYGGARNWDNIDASGGVVSSAYDMALLLDALRRDGGNLNTSALFSSVSTIEEMQDNSRGWVHDSAPMFQGVRSGGAWFLLNFLQPVHHSGTSEGSGSSVYMFPPHIPTSGANIAPRYAAARGHDNATFVLAFNRTRDKEGRQLWETLRTYLAEYMGQPTLVPGKHVSDWGGTDDLF